jgi:hypothetical protein
MHKITTVKRIKKTGSVILKTEDNFLQIYSQTNKQTLSLVQFSNGQIELTLYGNPSNLKVTTFKDIPVEVINRHAFSFAIVQTLQGNFILKEQSKLKGTELIEIELYGASLEDIKRQYRDHLNGLKKDGLI